MCSGLLIHCTVKLTAVLECAYQWGEEGKYISRTVLRTGYYFGPKRGLLISSPLLNRAQTDVIMDFEWR